MRGQQTETPLPCDNIGFALQAIKQQQSCHAGILDAGFIHR